MSVQFYLRIPPCAPADRIASFVCECEEAGFTGVGILDSPMLLRELFVTMAASALATSRIRLATAVTNPATRHASVLASAAKAVEELAPGRVEIWIGRGMTATGTIGQPPASAKGRPGEHHCCAEAPGRGARGVQRRHQPTTPRRRRAHPRLYGGDRP